MGIVAVWSSRIYNEQRVLHDCVIFGIYRG